MQKIRNFGSVSFNGNQSQIRYSHFVKNDDGTWEKQFGQQDIKNDVYIPNVDAVGSLCLGETQNYEKDLFGNPILVGLGCDFYDKNPPEPVRLSERTYGSDIHPTVKFLADSFEFDEDTDEIPPLRVHFMDIETIVDDKGFLVSWNVGPDRQGKSRGGITLISSYDNITKKNTMFGVDPYNGTEPLPSDTQYIWCKDEKGLIKEYLKYLKATDPDIITGWNCSDYDIPYIANRMVLLFGPNSLWRFGNGSIWMDNVKRRFSTKGINVIDYMILYKKFELTPRRSYSLDNITEVEGVTVDGAGKHKYSGSIKDFYEKDWNGFVRYCAQDAKLVYALDNKKKLIDTFVTCCYLSGIPFNQAIAKDVSWMRIHDAAIYRFCKEQGKQLPDKTEVPENAEKFAGAYVMAPKTGVYDYITVFDVASLYPSCIRALNISIEAYRGQVFSGDIPTQTGPYQVKFYSPFYLSLGEYGTKLLETYNGYNQNQIDVSTNQPIDYTFQTFNELKEFLSKYNYCVAANGAIFTKSDRGVIPALLDEWIAIRKKNKKLYFEYKQKHQETGEDKYKALSDRYNTIQQVYKIRLNSLYGFVGTIYSRFYHTDIAEAVTATGQYVIKHTIAELKKKNMFYDAMYCDTDSVFLNYGQILQHEGIDMSDTNKEACVKRCIEIDKEVKETIENGLNDICGNVMLTEQMYNFESEEVISKMLITSKKKYIARVVYDKTTGQYPEDEFTIKGMEFKKSNLSNNIKKFLKETTLKIMDGAKEGEIASILKNKFYELPNLPIDDISYVQGVRKIDQYASGSNIIINSPTDAIVYFPKKTPYHVSGTITLNALIDYDPELKGMDKVAEGEKGKIVFVTANNMFGVKAITLASSQDWLPKLYEYFTLDVEYMFKRLIIGPLQPTLDAIGFTMNMDSILGYSFVNTDNTMIQPILF